MRIALGFGINILRAGILAIMWRWFVAPFGLPQLTMPWAYGLISLLSILRPVRAVSKEQPDMDDALASGIILPLMILGEGWVAHWLMPR